MRGDFEGSRNHRMSQCVNVMRCMRRPDGAKAKVEPFPIARPVEAFPCETRRPNGIDTHTRVLAVETPVALVYGGTTEAVMMATPADLEDFAIGFSLTERLIATPEDVEELSIVRSEFGIELRMWLIEERAAERHERRRRIVGPTGCGLCGIESLMEAQRVPTAVRGSLSLSSADVARAAADIAALQTFNRETKAMHAAGFYRPESGIELVREDVGRHNALDKLCGAMKRGGINPKNGAIVITSRVSVEMVQKAAAIGAPILIAISAPTALAVRTAQAANITLVAVARGDQFQAFTHSQRVAVSAR